ncbi:MAG: LAGLIDADG family homing endonuclease [Methanofastidiosum sp.]
MTIVSKDVQKLLKQKNYFQKNETTWEDIAERVSKNIASLDPKYEKIFYDMISQMFFIPSTPCFTAGNKVTMYNGLVKNIEDISKGDFVLTHMGRPQKVTDVFVRETTEPIHTINVCKLIKNEFKCTGNHPIYAVKEKYIKYPSGHIKRNLKNLKIEPEWINAKNLVVGDYVVIGKFDSLIVDKDKIIVSDILKNMYDVEIKNNYIYKYTKYITPNGIQGKTIKYKGIPNEISINEQFLTLVGYFLSEGYVDLNNNRIRITFHKNERSYINYVFDAIKDIFNLEPIREYNRNTCTVVVHNNILPYLFHELFGSYGHTVHLTSWMMLLPDYKQKYILKGILQGDGCHYVAKNHTSKDTPDRIKITLNNRELISQLFYIFLKLGYYCTISKNYNKKHNKFYYTIEIAPSYSRELCDLIDKNKFKKRRNQEFYKIINGYLLFPILEINTSIENTKVYNLEVEQDHSYVVNGICVHNCLLNAGTNVQQLSSCFIIDIDDSIESIMNTAAECAKIFQKSGGAGFNISNLRPKGSPLKNSGGQASGPVSFMKIFDAIVEEVKHGNSRKGALKIDLDCNHPDIFEFIHCKDDIDNLKNMNISVSITDEFINAVKNNEDWELKFEDKTFKKIKAKDLWNEIITSAWKTGEPGISFVSLMDRENMNPHLGMVKSSNPCLHKDTYMVTENGLEKISKLKSKTWNGKEFTKIKTWKTGIKKVIKIMTNSGFEYITTPNHKFLLENGNWCEAQNLIGKKIKFEIKEKQWKGINKYSNINYEVLGFEFGDGSYHKASKRMKYIHVNPKDDIEVIQLIEKLFNEKAEPQHSNKPDIAHIIKIPYGTIYADAFHDKLENRMIPDWIMKLPKNEMKSFLKGLFSANGTNLKDYRKIQLVSVNAEMLKQIQQMLLMFGIKGKLWYHSKQNNIEFSNGEYICKQSAHIVISRDSYKKYLDDIGFIQEYKNGYQEYNNKDDEEYETVILISELGKEEVWDFSEPKLHQAITNGAFVHNCSEYVNIPYSSCNLGSLNLLKFVENQEFNWDKFEQYIKYAVRFLDNMISVNKLPLPKIQEVTELIRPIGLGTMGLADALFALGIAMNSKKGLDFIDKLYSFLYKKAEEESQKLAEEKGVYPAWKGSKWEEKGIKIRNSSLLSVAPNGTIGFIAGVNGGIEPIFSLAYTRRTAEGDEYFVVNSILERELRKLDMFNDEIIEKIIKNNGSIKGIKEIPKRLQNIFVTAMDMTPEEHIECLEKICKHVDLSASKTINLPKYASIEDVANVYLKAWETGVIKGITVYRDNSREDQILSIRKDKKLKRGEVKPAPEESSDSKTVKLYSGCGTLWVTLTKDENKNIDQIFVSRGSKGTCVANQIAVSRLISLALRGGINAKDIVDQLLSIPTCAAYYGKKQKGEKVSRGSSCPAAIGIVLDRYSQEKEENDDAETEPNICPDCGETLLMTSSCVSCPFCGFSKCG